MASDTLYRLLLHVLPREVRRADGDSMVQLFRDYRREAAGHPIRLAWLWVAALRDVFGVAAASRTRRTRSSPSRTMSISTLGSDFRHGLRLLRRYPSTSLLAVATLALGTGVNTAIFSVVDAVLLRCLPYAEPDRLARVWESRPAEGSLINPVSPADFLDWRRLNQVFERAAAHVGTTVSLSGDGEPLQLDGAAVSAGFFELLRIQPALGRTFTADEEIIGKHRVAIISDSLWHRRFGADPAVVRRTVSLNGNPWRIIGVLPAGFQFIEQGIDVWAPLALEGGPKPPSRGSHSLDVYARLKPGVTIAQANDAMDRLGRELAAEHPDTSRGHSARVVAMQDDFVRPIRTSLLLLFAAVGFILLIACLNVASLLLARAASRTREMAVRAALGASRGRLLTQTLIEGLALALAGGVAGLAVARLTIAALPAVMPEQLSIVGLSAVALDWRVLAFALALSILTGVIFSILPAWQISRPHVVESLKAGGRNAPGVRGGARLTLVIGEVALAALILTGAGLAIRSFGVLLAEPLGFQAAHRTAITVWLPTVRYPTPEVQRTRLDDLERRFTAIAGVTAIGAIDILPLAGDDSRRGVTIEGQQEALEAPTRMHPRSITPGYFHAMAIPIVTGRTFFREDDERALPVAIVNEAAARRFWPNGTAIGKRFRFNDTEAWRAIVGVAGDVRHWGLDLPVNPMVYLPQAQVVSDSLTFVLESRVDTPAVVAAVRAQLGEFDPNLPLGNVDTLDALVASSLRPERAQMVLMASFGALALALAAVGIYGVMAQLAAVRVHEIGVRLSLGARPIDILRRSLVDGLLQTSVGLAIGLSAGAYLMRFAQSVLFGVKPWDVLTLTGVSAVLITAALVACLVPARRAMRINPVEVLRSQ